MASSNTRIIRTNWATSAGGRTLSVTPAEDADGPALNMLKPDRYTCWKCPNTGGAVSFVVNLGAARSVDYVGVSGLVRPSGASFPTSFNAYSYTTYPNPTIASCTVSAPGSTNITRASGSFITDGVKVGMTVASPAWFSGLTVLTVAALTVTMTGGASSSGTTTFTFTDVTAHGTFNISQAKDAAFAITRVSRRYWQLDFNLSTGFSLGAPIIAFKDADTDLGIAWSPGSGRTRQRNVQEYRTAGGHPCTVRLGDDRVEWQLQFQNRLKAAVDSLESALFQDPTLLGYPHLIDPWDATHQVRPVDWSVEHVFGAGSYDLLNAAVTLEKLP